MGDNFAVMNYEKVFRDKTKSFVGVEHEGEIRALKISTMPYNFYISDRAKVKPRALHEIKKAYNKARSATYKTGYTEPRLVIVAGDEIGGFYV